MMKYFVVVADGAADYPVPELNNRTPFQVAYKPNIDYLSCKGKLGMMKTIPDGMHPGSDIANMNILGYDPQKYYTGRGPLEAAALHVEFEDKVVFRCNLVTIRGEILEDYSAGHISRDEAGKIIDTLNEWAPIGRFYLGLDYRNLFILEDCDDGLTYTPPHDICGREFRRYMLGPPSNEWAKKLNELMLESRKILEEHPVNIQRRLEGKRPANMIWLWGQGRKPKMEPLVEKYGVRGVMISAVYLIKGMGILTGMKVPEVPGATGYYDSNLEGKAKAAIEGIKSGYDLAYIHVEATDEAGHEGNVEMKVKMIERIDREIVGRILDEMPDSNIAFLPDHPTPLTVRTHVADLVPVVIYFGDKGEGDRMVYDEFTCRKGSLGILQKEMLMLRLLNR